MHQLHLVDHHKIPMIQNAQKLAHRTKRSILLHRENILAKYRIILTGVLTRAEIAVEVVVAAAVAVVSAVTIKVKVNLSEDTNRKKCAV